MKHQPTWVLPLALTLSACAAEVPPAVDTQSAAVSSSFPRDARTLLDELRGVMSQDAGRFAAYLDILRTDDAAAARLLEEARVISAATGGTEHRLVLFVIGQIAHERSIDGLESELARCVARPAPPRSSRPRQLTCTPVNGDLPPSCSVPAHPELFDAITQGEAAQMHALDAFDAIGYRYRSSAISARFRTTLDHVLANRDCGRPLRDAAAIYLIERSPDSRAARRDLERRYPADTQFASLRWRDPVLEPAASRGGRR